MAGWLNQKTRNPCGGRDAGARTRGRRRPGKEPLWLGWLARFAFIAFLLAILLTGASSAAAAAGKQGPLSSNDRLLAYGSGLPPSPAARPSGLRVPSQAPAGDAGGSEIEPYSKHPTETQPYAVCPPPTKTRTSCMSAVAPLPGAAGVLSPGAAGLGHAGSSITPGYAGSGVWGGFSPGDLRSAYNLPSSGGSGLTVAVTIAYDNPNAEANLATYRSYYGLPPCTSASGCFKKVNQNGEAGNYPAGNEEWALETSLDLDMVSAACPECHILLVEANDPNYENMAAVVDKAAQLGADVISNSWAGEEFPEEISEDSHFNHPGIPTLFASGDWGYRVEYPAASPYAIAVGGTSLRPAGNVRGWSETAWSGAGSGCSRYEPKPAWQNDTGCSMRTVADVSAVSDPETPVSIYDTYGTSGWLLVGGTSAATPLVAGIEALSSSAFRAAGPSAFWRAGYGTGLFDVTEGENGVCAVASDSDFAATYLCQADTGYDGPSGWGSPNGPLSLPGAITEQPTIAAGKATLHGSVNPNGLPTEYLFEYGETTSYGEAVPIPNGNVGSGSEYVRLSQTVAGLKAETTYHYRITAINTSTFHGVDRTFGITPPLATTGPPSDIRSSVATVKGTVNPRGTKASYYVEYGPTTAYGHKAPAKAGQLNAGTANVNVSAEMTGLSGGTPYHYRFVARNVAGTAYGDDETLVTERAEWIVADMPQPPNSGLGEEAFGVSCLPTEECFGVGSNWSLDLHASATLAERWDGITWEPMTTPNPDGLQEGWEHQRFATLRGISCSSSSDCIAVGYYKGTSELIQPLSERWDGTEWSMLEPALPAGEEAAVLQSVSCLSADDCWAAGAYVPAGTTAVKTMIEHWDGAKWSVESTPNPVDAKETRLYGISCPSSSNCVAVGAYITTTPEAEETLALHWDGTEWLQHETVNAGERSTAALSDVSCATATACVAVGSYQRETTRVTLAERWNGTNWSLQSTPTPHSEGGLTGVSCTTSTQCTAAGYFYNPEGTDHGWRSLIERWSGGAWSQLEIAQFSMPSGWWHEDYLSGVSCTEPEACNAVGSHLEAPEGQLASMFAFSEHEVTAPFPAFSSTPSGPLTGEPVSFDASATSDPGHSITSYQWNFGDGTTASGPEPSHTFAHAGAYAVRLTVTDDIGRTGSISRFVDVTNRPPTASFAINTAEPVGAQPVAFDASGSGDPDGTIAGYHWDFGDGGTAEGPAPSHAYAHAGSYTVTLTVVDNDGGTGDSTQSLAVANGSPSASFAVGTPAPTAAQPISFDGTASTDHDGSVAAYSWDFGDGGSASGPAPSHTYAKPGAYSVTLTVTDNEGKSAKAVQPLVVADAVPLASFATGAAATAGRPVSFDASASGDPDGAIARYSWDFGDGSGGEGPQASHVYTKAGSYKAKLTVTDDGGMSTSTQRVISIAEPSNRVRLISIEHHGRSHGVTLKIWVPGPGVLSAGNFSTGFRHSGPATGRIRPVSATATDAGSIKLQLRPTAATRRLLARRHTLQAPVLISFAPSFGTPAVRMRTVVFRADSSPSRG